MPKNKKFNPEEKVEQAMGLFWEKGYSKTSMEDIVNTLRINRGSIYDTYQDKHQLFLQSLNRYSHLSLEKLQNAIIKNNSPLKALEEILKGVVRDSLSDIKGKACLTVKSSFEMASENQDVYRINRTSALNSISLLEKLIAESQQRGEISSGKEAKRLAAFFYASQSSIRFMATLFKDKMLLQQLADDVMSVIKG